MCEIKLAVWRKDKYGGGRRNRGREQPQTTVALSRPSWRAEIPKDTYVTHAGIFSKEIESLLCSYTHFLMNEVQYSKA